MADPVLLVETGMTFDRASIQEWLSRGNQTCPLTHQRLTSGQVRLSLILLFEVASCSIIIATSPESTSHSCYC